MRDSFSEFEMILIVQLLLLLLLLCCHCSHGEVVDLNVIYIGSALGNEDHPLSSLDSIWPAVLLAAEGVNKAEGFLEGYHVTVSKNSWNGSSAAENGSHLLNRCSKKAVLDAFYSQVLDWTLDVGVVGGGCLEATEVLVEASHGHKLPMVSFSPLVGGGLRSTSPYLASVVPAEGYIAAGMAAVLKSFGWTRAAVIRQGLPEFAAMTSRLANEVKSEEVSLVEVVLPALRDSLDELQLFPRHSNIFILNTYSTQARWIICKARAELEWMRRSYVWLLQGWYEDSWWEKRNVLQEGGGDCSNEEVLNFLQRQRVLTVSHLPVLSESSWLTSFGLNSSDLMEKYHSHLAESGVPFSEAGLLAHDALWALALGLNSSLAGANDTTTCITQAAAVVASGIGSGWREMQPCMGGAGGSVRNRSFVGLTGRVEIASGLRKLEGLVVRQFREGDDGYPVVAGRIQSSPDNKEFVVVWEAAPPLWNETPSDGAVVQKVRHYYTWLWVSSYIINSIVIAAAIFCLVFTVLFRNRKIVKMTSPNLNCVVVVGILCLVGSTFIFVHPPSKCEGLLATFCILRLWLISIGFSLCFGTINVKMWRIFYIFRNPAIKKRVFKDWHLFLVVCVMVTVDLLILVPATIAPPTRMWPRLIPDVEHLNYTNERGEVVMHVVSSCAGPKIMAVLVVLFGYKAVIQLVGIILAFSIRNVQITVLNDSKEIRLSLYLTSVILLAVIVITSIFHDHLNIYGAGYCFGNPLSALSVLIVVFFSKMFRLYKDPRGSSIFTSTPVGVKSTASICLDASDSPEVAKLKMRVKQLMEEVSEAEKRLKKLDKQIV